MAVTSAEIIVGNVVGKVRREKLHGRDYLVAPMTMIVPGVMVGSNGPLYYPAPLLQNDPSVWNHMPITNGHPKDKGGKHVSARDPEVIQTHGLGSVFRTAYNGKLGAEAWFDVENARRVEPRVVEALERGEPMELSTGLFTDTEPADEGATHNGTAYTHEVKAYRPDHLAVLLDSPGACSLEHGCGVLVNEDEEKKTLWRKVGEALGLVKPNDLAANCSCGTKPAATETAPTTLPQGTEGGTQNASKGQMSHDELRMKIHQAVRGQYRQDEPSPYVHEVFDKHVVFEHAGDLHQQEYEKPTDGAGDVKMKGKPVKVKRQVSYEPVTGNSADTPRVASIQYIPTDNQEPTMGLTANDRLLAVKFITSNSDQWKFNGAADGLLKMDDQFLSGVKATVESEVKLRNPTPVAPTPAPIPTGNEKKPTFAEMLANHGTPQEQAVWNSAVQIHQRERNALVEKLVANGRDDNSKTALRAVYSSMSDEHLRALAANVQTPAPQQGVGGLPNYSGAGFGDIAGLTGNGGGDDIPETLALPTVNWAEEERNANPRGRATA